MRKIITIHDCKLLAHNKGGECLSSIYVNARTNVEWKCKCGYIWYACYDGIRSGKWCKICGIKSAANSKRKSLEQYVNEVSLVHDNLIIVVSAQYKNTETRILHKCIKCESKFFSKPAHVISGHGCPYCSGNKVNHTNSLAARYPEIANQWHPTKNKITPDMVLHGCKNKVWWLCANKHQYIQAVFKKVHYGQQCPFCAHQISAAQLEIYNHLTNIYANYLIVLNDENIIKPFDLDIYIPELKTAIEYDGEYWHYSDRAIKHGSLERMNRKDKVCVEKNIRLLRIREYEWLANQELMLQQIIDFLDDKGSNYGTNNNA